MEYDRPIVLSIAGLDPCGGAGLLADIKTIEQHQCLGFGVATAITCQTEDQFESIRWLTEREIIGQIKPLLHHYNVAAVKIGLMENVHILNRTLNLLIGLGIAKIVWDPVLATSTGFEFYNLRNILNSPHLLGKITLITPNLHEATHLANNDNALSAAEALSNYTSVLLKGGHDNEDRGTDYLYMQSRRIRLEPTVKQNLTKHGSGCILSSSIASSLAKNKSLESACTNAKLYIEKILASTPHLLAYHNV